MSGWFPTLGDIVAMAGWLAFAALIGWLRWEQWRDDRRHEVERARRPLGDRWAGER